MVSTKKDKKRNE